MSSTSTFERALRAAERAAARGESGRELDASVARALARRSNPCGVSESQARTRYRLTHWGLGGRDKEKARPLSCADPTCGVFTLLGKLVSVCYATEKGGEGGPAEYEHEFSGPLPELLYSDGGLVIAGGRYRVGVRGIVG